VKRLWLVDYLVYVVVRVLICAAQAIPLETGAWLAGGLAWLFGDLLRVRGEVVDDNLRHAFPQLSDAQRHRLARRMWRHLFLLAMEVAQAPRKVRDTTWRRYVRLRNIPGLMRQFMDDRPTMLVTGHFGNFELGGFMLGLLGYPTYTIARTLDNPYLDRFIHRFRGVTGQYIIPKSGGYEQILEVLGGGGIMAFLADQAAGGKGCWIEFFGRPASAHKAIALLALENRARLAVVYARRLDRPMQFEMVVEAIADPHGCDGELRGVRELTQWYTRRLEDAIRRDPEQYWWLHRRWKDTRPRHRQEQQRAA